MLRIVNDTVHASEDASLGNGWKAREEKTAEKTAHQNSVKMASGKSRSAHVRWVQRRTRSH